MTIRRATAQDAASLHRLNKEFNGPHCTTIESITQQLLSTGTEWVWIIADNTGDVGFCCVQITQSICYDHPSAEMTELYIQHNARCKGYAALLMQAAESYCRSEHIQSIRLLTGYSNTGAQHFYQQQGYVRDDEVLFEKRLSSYQP